LITHFLLFPKQVSVLTLQDQPGRKQNSSHLKRKKKIFFFVVGDLNKIIYFSGSGITFI